MTFWGSIPKACLVGVIYLTSRPLYIVSAHLHIVAVD